MEDEKMQNVLTKDEVDTIGEILNISMGSASTALSALLDKQVVITPPTVTLEALKALDYTELEPAILVKIQYIEGISGSNVMLFRQHDMQIILNLLMGTDEPPRDDFEFDELSMSAACEVMNQMMGSSATALSDVLSTKVDISTPEAFVITDQPLDQYIEVTNEETVIAVSFGMNIDDVMSTSFASVMSHELARNLINKVLGDQAAALEEIPSPAYTPRPPAAAPAATPPPAAAAPAAPAPAAAVPTAPPPPAAAPVVPPMSPVPPAAAVPSTAQPMPGMPEYPAMPGYPPYGYPMPGYPGYPPYGYPVPPQGAEASGAAEAGVIKQPVNVQTAQFPNFAVQSAPVSYGANSSMDLLMNVPLNVSVEIGKTKRKIKEIIDFGQGTVLELDKQAGAPVEIVVNGQPIARGDVVVIEDNFGVRITEILGMKDLMESLGNNKG